MRLAGYELLKIINKRTILFLIPLLLLGNIALYCNEQFDKHGDAVRLLDDYRSLEEAYRKLPPEQAWEKLSAARGELGVYSSLVAASLNPDNEIFAQEAERIKAEKPELLARFDESGFLSNPDGLSRQLYVTDKLYQDYAATRSYGEYLGGIQKRADDLLSVSIFQNKNSFSYRNIVKTSNEFSSLGNLTLKPYMEEGVVTGTRFPVTDVLLVVGILLVGVYLFLQEKENGLVRLLRTNKKGRSSLILAKLSVYSAVSVLLCLAFYGSVLLAAHKLYGFGDTGRSIQSMKPFWGSNLAVTVNDYFVLYLMAKVLAVLTLAFIISLLFLSCSSAGIALGLLSVLLGLSGVAFALIHPASHVGLFKYLNLIAPLDSFDLLGQYHNLNLWGYPINRTWATFGFLAAMLAALPPICVKLYTGYPKGSQGNERGWLPFVRKRKTWVRRYSSRIFSHELRKVLITGKACWVLLAALIFAYGTLDFSPSRYNHDDAVYNQYVQRMAGSLTEEKALFLEKENARFANLPKQMQDIEALYHQGKLTLKAYNEKINEARLFAANQKGFNKIYKQYLRLKQVKAASDIPVSFVNELESDYLFDWPERDLRLAFAVFFLLILALSPVFPVDLQSGIVSILRSTRRGRWGLFRTKYTVSLLLAILMYLLIYAPLYFRLFRNYNFGEWTAPVQSLSQFEHFPVHMSILSFTVSACALQLSALFILVMCTLFVTLLVRRLAAGILLNLTLWVTPLLIQYFGISFVGKFSLNQAVLPYSALANVQSLGSFFFYLAALAILAGCATIGSWKIYNGNFIRGGAGGGHGTGNKERMQNL